MRRQCCDVNQTQNHLFLSIRLLGLGFNKGTGVFRADVDEHDSKIPNTQRKKYIIWWNIGVDIFCSVLSKFNGRRGTILPFSVEIFFRVRAWELVHNFQRTELGCASVYFLATKQIRGKFQNGRADTIRALSISKWKFDDLFLVWAVSWPQIRLACHKLSQINWSQLTKWEQFRTINGRRRINNM